ncbi:MAG TPA: porin family protein [Verrucomicrobiae bacterium]|nr:porin family protein [Verrucomicrobiae bacterium]
MKNFLFLLVLSPLLLWAQDPSLPKKQYVGIGLGTDYCFKTNQSNSGLKVGVKAELSYGYKFNSGFRAELEASFRKNSFQTKYDVAKDDQLRSKRYHSLHSWAYMGNLLYDLNQLIYQGINPYVGIGVGYAQCVEKVKYKSSKEINADKFRDDRFVYQGIVGARYSINETLDVSAEYKYLCGLSHAKDHSVSLALLRNF